MSHFHLAFFIIFNEFTGAAAGEERVHAEALAEAVEHVLLGDQGAVGLHYALLRYPTDAQEVVAPHFPPSEEVEVQLDLEGVEEPFGLL